MGTGPGNFPPENALDIGGLITASKLNATAGFLATPLFTAPTTGLYQVGLLLRFIASDGTGTINISLNYPHQGPNTINAIVPAVNGDQSLPPETCWMNGGDVITVAVTTTGLGATTFNVYVPALRVF